LTSGISPEESSEMEQVVLFAYWSAIIGIFWLLLPMH
jgi:hypothetical protein